MKICSKAQFFKLWEAGLLGNRTRLWRDPGEAFDWAEVESRARKGFTVKPDVSGMERAEIYIGFREIRRPGTTGAGKWEKVPWQKVFETAKRWRAEGRDFIMDDGAPDEYRTLQGELCRTTRGMEGFLSLGSKLPMRPDMAAGNMKHYSYAATLRLIDIYMDPPSREDVDTIFELYPDAAIEFTCFTVSCGILNRNTIFWEVRDY